MLYYPRQSIYKTQTTFYLLPPLPRPIPPPPPPLPIRLPLPLPLPAPGPPPTPPGFDEDATVDLTLSSTNNASKFKESGNNHARIVLPLIDKVEYDTGFLPRLYITEIKRI